MSSIKKPSVSVNSENLISVTWDYKLSNLEYSEDGGKTWRLIIQNQSAWSNSWTYDLWKKGSLQFRAVQSVWNGAGFTYSYSEVASYAAPAVSYQDTGISATDRITSNGKVSVSGLITGEYFKYSTDGGKTWSAKQTGNSFDLADAVYSSVQVKTFTSQGVMVIELGELRVDKVAPLAIRSITLAQDLGLSGDDRVTSNGQFKVSGLVTGGYYQYSTDGGVTWSDYQTVNTFTLAEGSYSPNALVVRAIDAAGNVSASTVFKAGFVIDKTAPSASSISLSLAVDTGASATDGITSNGQINVSGIEAGGSFKYSTDGGLTWSVVQKQGKQAFNIAEGSRAAGSVQVKSIDAAGNTSDDVAKLGAVTIKANAALWKPAVTIDRSSGTVRASWNSTPDYLEVTTDSGGTWKKIDSVAEAKSSANTSQWTLKAWESGTLGFRAVSRETKERSTEVWNVAWVEFKDTGLNSADGITSNGWITVRTLEALTCYKYSTDFGKSWSDIIKGNSANQFQLLPGVYAAGAVRIYGETKSKTFNFALGAICVDTSAPSSVSLSLAQDTGSSATDGITSNVQINVSGIEAGQTFKYSTDGGKSWTVAAKDKSSFTVKSNINKHVYDINQIQVQGIDTAGNVSGITTLGRKVVFKTWGSPATIGLEEDTGISASDGITTNGKIILAANAPYADYLEYSTDGGKTWSAKQYDLKSGTFITLTEGVYAKANIQVRTTDLAGNTAVSSMGATGNLVIELDHASMTIDQILSYSDSKFKNLSVAQTMDFWKTIRTYIGSVSASVKSYEGFSAISTAEQNKIRQLASRFNIDSAVSISLNQFINQCIGSKGVMLTVQQACRAFFAGAGLGVIDLKSNKYTNNASLSQTSGSQNISLWGDDNALTVEDITQNGYGDCVLLSGMISQIQDDAKRIQAMVYDNKDGSYTITTKQFEMTASGGAQQIRTSVTINDTLDLNKFASKNEKDSPGKTVLAPALFEKAYVLLRSLHGELAISNNTVVPGYLYRQDGFTNAFQNDLNMEFALTGGKGYEGLEFFSSKGYTNRSGIAVDSTKDWKDTFVKDWESGSEMVLGCSNYFDEFVGGHAYAVVGISRDANSIDNTTITLRNPWGDGSSWVNPELVTKTLSKLVQTASSFVLYSTGWEKNWAAYEGINVLQPAKFL